jgi:DNA polymerase III epsilon subunit family exonuclease
MTASPTAPATAAAALATLWAQLRLVVIDVEITAADDGLHVVEVAAVICRAGRRTSRSWTARVNPGVPIDARSQAIHGISDDDLIDEPPFADIVPELTRRLRGLDGETVVLVAHNVGFDVGVLRREFARLALEFRDLPVLDTKLVPRHVGLNAGRGSLPDLAAALGVTHLDAHTAHADAEATADDVIALLERACLAGHRDFDALHALVMRSRARTSSIRASASRRVAREDAEPRPEVDLPEEHTARHGDLLTDDGPRAVAAWASS